MGNGGGQTSGGGKLFNFQHAPLYFELLHLAKGREIAQDCDGISHLAALTIDLAGASIVVNLLPERGIIETQRRGFPLGKRRRKCVDKSRELGLVLELD